MGLVAYPVDSMDSIKLALSLLPFSTDMKPHATPDQPQNGRPTRRWLIVVSRSQADLYEHLVQAFSRDTKVRVILDRRKDESRNSPQIAHRLRTHGAVVIRQSE